MASTLESEASFKARAKEIGLAETVVNELVANGVKSFGSLAFITPYRPGQPGEAPLIEALKKALNRDPTNPELIILRRLFFESCALALSDMKQRTERDDTSEPTRMPVAERNARLSDQKNRLTGLHFSPENEPSHKLVDMICQMGVDQTLEWIPWEKLTSRAAEITHSQKDFKISFDSQGGLKVAPKHQTPDAVITGEMKVRQALNRRARALDLAAICGYNKMEEWRERVFEIVGREPAPNALPVSLHQVKEADKALFRRLAEKTRGGLVRLADGTKPMEKEFEDCMNHPEVQFCLIPMVRTGKSANENNHVSYANPSKGKGKGHGVKKDFNKDKGAGQQLQLPPNCNQMTKDGKPICESEYPLLLCQRFVALIKSHLVSTFSFNPQVAQPGAHQQSRKHRALIPEYHRFHLSLPEHAREVLKGKRLLLFKHLLQESGCPDLEAFDLMQGVHLVGVATRSPFFGDKIVPATTTPEFAVLSNKWQRKKIEAKNIHADDPELSKTLWETIMQEVDRGFLQGPYESLEEVHQVLEAKGTVCSRRFAIMQSGKPRIIDDLKESGVNRAFTAVDRLTLHDIDYVTSFCHFITTTIKHALESSEKTVEVKLKDGSILRGSLHSDFHEPCVWKGRCIDLSKAYKQIPVSSQSRKFAVLMVHHFETERPVYFLSRSLPFGASASVFGFNRISKSLWHIATKGCLMMGGVFFDDFPIVEPESLCSLASKSVEGLLKALGWQYSDDPKKVVPVDYAFDVLGTRIDVSGLHGRSFSLENKQSRLERIDALLKEVQEADAISKRQAQVIHGNLNFAMSFFLGHTMRIAARAFAALTMDNCKPAPGQITDLCTWARGVLQFLAPKVIDPSGDPRPVVLFTDAVYEDDVATWGMVLLDPVTDTRTAVGGRVPDFLVQKWHALGSDQVITLAEAFAALLARIVFRSYISQRRVLIFVDNEGARHCLIKATSQTLALLQIVQLFHGCAEVDRCIPWIERVPSASNVADLPSRNKTEEAMAIIDGSPWTSEVDVEAVAEMCCNFNGLPRILTKLTCNAFEASFDPLLHDDNTGD
ncbi:unnamed protein product [Durusdinium trenchii]|uniref:Uncharacterized protein n=1 Tax=Durusdinium trenchii TaxID=1381693 RepID=A0ABP0REY2_9DINO